jgi:hypothetical protein
MSILIKKINIYKTYFFLKKKKRKRKKMTEIATSFIQIVRVKRQRHL